jgi:alkylation response protein AidB-like acyl-CoA dehydrogenase
VGEDLEAFRAEVRDWLKRRWSERDPAVDDEREDTIARTPDGHEAFVAAARRFQRELAAAGLAGLTVPVAYGGRGLGPDHARILAEELERFDTPSLRPLGIARSLVAPTLLHAGTEDQKRTHLPPLVRGETQWCQLFSEPDAGSDLASLRTTAVPDGEVWRVNGQKVWSSYAADADFGILLARTDPDARPQAGITMFILDMAAPGVTVRPLTDIAGGRHFNEVFLDDVVIAASEIVGRLHGGWDVANGTLGGERSGYLGGSGGGRRARQVATATGSRPRSAVEVQRQVAVTGGERILEWLSQRTGAGLVAGGHPAAGSLIKLAAGNLEQEAAEAVVDHTGPGALAWEPAGRDGDKASQSLAASRQSTIAGGTHQIQRNLVGERILGLPREPKPTARP